MTKEEIEAIEKVRKQLKHFQTKTVEFVVNRLQDPQSIHKVLVADEVGMGKTIIAKGVIAQFLANRTEKAPFHVVYICSNQVLAHANLKKLSPFVNVNRAISRLSFLAFKPAENKDNLLHLSSLTPNTSFRITRSVGLKEERALMYKLLVQYVDYQQRDAQLRNLLKGNKQVEDKNWKASIDKVVDEENGYGILRKDVAKKFRDRLKDLEFPAKECPRTVQLLGAIEGKCFDWVLQKVLDNLKYHQVKKYEAYWYELIRQLRLILTEVCADYLIADLFILDEFQRFKVLLDTDEKSEAGIIAKKILQRNEAQVLLLSATPFKPYTTQIEELIGENHHTELERIVKFLGGDKGESLWNEFQKNQQEFFQVLYNSEDSYANLSNSIQVKEKLEYSFKKFMSRNERLYVAKEKDNMTQTHLLEIDDIDLGDIENFIALDQIVTTIHEENPRLSKNFGSTLEFAKSAPYALSYLYGYNIHKHLFDHLGVKSIKEILQKSEDAFLNYQAINAYKAVGYYKGEPNYPNPKFRLLARECFDGKSELLLWVPPSRPYYKSSGVFKNKEQFSKILVFSSWVMVPRAISTLITYEAERRTIAAEDINQLNEKEERSYFDKPRKPSPLIRFSKRETGDLAQRNNLILFYPSRALIMEGSLLKDLDSFDYTSSQIQRFVIKKIKKLFQDLKLKEKFLKNKNNDNKWYRLAPALMDKLSGHFDTTINSCIKHSSGLEREYYLDLKNQIDKIYTGKMNLGKLPKDLFEKLSLIALASPGNASLLAIENVYPEASWNNKVEQAFKISSDFRSLFNRPESISAIRLAVQGKSDYWLQTLEYCFSGNILAMLEEYFYLLKDCENLSLKVEGDALDLAKNFKDIIGVVPSPLQVDMKMAKNLYAQKAMRCHFAMSFGESKGVSDDGKTRDMNVRTLFNSPFRPFVLSSTSIGQEGLDFHYYCRKIFHWNLPHNAIDIEQREGRINRFKSLTIRKRIIESCETSQIVAKMNKSNTSVWEALFKHAEESHTDKTEIMPFWYLDEGHTNIERFIPIHPLSRDKGILDKLKQTIALYRLTFGQPRQEELIEVLKSSNLNDEQLDEIRHKFLLDLSPLKD